MPSAGLLVLPAPQATTVPSDFRARLCRKPAEIARAIRPVGTIDWPDCTKSFVSIVVPPPHATTVPFERKARLWEIEAATAATFVALDGMFRCPYWLLP